MARNVKVSAPWQIEQAAWDVDQARRFLHAASHSPYDPIWAVFLQTGMRRGEVLGLRWEDVDLTRGVMSIRTTVGLLGNKPVMGEPKTKRSRRDIAIPAGLDAALHQHRIAYLEKRVRMDGAWEDNGLVFASETGKPINPSNLRRDFNRWREKAGVPELKVHGLRHTYATLAFHEGADLLQLSRHLGHARPSITSDIYAHVLHTDHADVADRVGALFTGTHD